jgi:hypothetical protein
VRLQTASKMKGVVWDIRVDAAFEPTTFVVAVDWYEARALASAKLNVAKERIHVSMRQKV